MRNISSLNWIGISILAIFLAGCAGIGNSGYTIEGTLVNGKGQTVYLQKLTDKKITRIDTAAVDDQGNFSMRGAVDEEGLYQLFVPNVQAKWVMILDNAEELRVRLDATDPVGYVVEGGTGNELILGFNNFLINEQRAMQEMNQRYVTLTRTGGSPQQIFQLRDQITKRNQQVEQQILHYIDTTSNVYAALYGWSFLNENVHYQRLGNLVRRMEKEIPNSTYFTAYRGRYRGLAEQARRAEEQRKLQEQMAGSVSIGSEAPEISLPSPNGKVIPLSSLRGKVVLLDFWASWCGPCRHENPNVVRTYQKYKNQGFTVYSVSLDRNRNKWIGAIQQDKLSWNSHVSDLKFWQSEAARTYGVNSIPQAFLIDKAGVIVAKNLRGPALENRVAELLASQS